jgi:hypothetical protein
MQVIKERTNVYKTNQKDIIKEHMPCKGSKSFRMKNNTQVNPKVARVIFSSLV